MKLSVLIPIYNVEKYIQRCAESLFTQSDKKNVEFIFVNDCTKDNSISLLEDSIKKYGIKDDQYKIINHKKNKGLAAARNTGLDYATGDYIMFLDSDDTLEPNSIEILKETIKLTTPDIVVFGMRFVYPDGITRVAGGNFVSIPKDKYLNDVLSRNCHVTVCGKLYSRRLFELVRFIEGLNYGEDYATLPRLIYFANKIVDLCSIILYNYHQDNSSSYTNSQIGRLQMDNILKAINILDNFFKHDPNYIRICNQIRIRNKIFLLEYVDKKYRTEVLNSYNELNSQNLYLPLKHRIVWNLARKRFDKLLSLFLDFSQFIKNKLHI
ncbi:MAG: glycosyltransferase [Muribaculaceae bacterium]|nr:glycosyltransferase [Muribaculaceae bacterium]